MLQQASACAFSCHDGVFASYKLGCLVRDLMARGQSNKSYLGRRKQRALRTESSRWNRLRWHARGGLAEGEGARNNFLAADRRSIRSNLRVESNPARNPPARSTWGLIFESLHKCHVPGSISCSSDQNAGLGGIDGAL